MKQFTFLTCLVLFYLNSFAQSNCFREIPLTNVINYNLASEGFNTPRGNVILGNVPFQLPIQGNTSWNANVGFGPNPRTVLIPIQQSGVKNIYSLINTFWGSPSGIHARIILQFSDGTTQIKELQGNSDIRDFRQNNYTNTINNLTTVNVYNSGSDRLDMLRISVNDTNTIKVLSSILIEDNGTQGFQRIVLSGLTLGLSGPIILTQPLNYVSNINGSSLFTLISNDSTATHHWQSNSGFGFQDLYNAGQYSGVTSSTLTVSNTSLQNNNQLFRCIVTTPNCGSDTSDIVTLTVSSSGQGPALPRKFNYQAVVRDSMGALITNRNVSLRVTLLRGSAPHSPELFKETHQANTNATGLLTVKIGNGQSILGSMDSIDWSQGMVYLRTEIDPTGGNTFSMVNTAELLSVPYALYSLNSGGGPSGPAGPQGPSGPMGLQGVQGAPGNDGVGILSITNTGNNMVITLSNGNTYSVPLPAPNDQAAKNAKTLIYTTDGF
jgi:hypothetical protein